MNVSSTQIKCSAAMSVHGQLSQVVAWRTAVYLTRPTYVIRV